MESVMLHQHHLHRRTRMSLPGSQTGGVHCQFKASYGAAEMVDQVCHSKHFFMLLPLPISKNISGFVEYELVA